MKIVTVIFVFLTMFLSACTSTFTKLPTKDLALESLLKQIKPNASVQYWQLEYYSDYVDISKGYEVIFSQGQIGAEIENNIINNQNDYVFFFYDCRITAGCAYRVSYFENNIWKGVTSEFELKAFIGDVDNVSEAFLLGKLGGYSFDLDSGQSNSFVKEDNGYKIKMMKYHDCPDTKESFTIFVSNSGQITDVKSNGLYWQSNSCILI